MSNYQGWIGVDLDGTLAEYTGWKGPEHIGEPILPMINRVRTWRIQGKKVKLFTTRAGAPEQIPFIQAWLDKHEFGDMEITNVKDFAMIELWDDRAVQIIPNTGKRADGKND